MLDQKQSDKSASLQGPVVALASANVQDWQSITDNGRCKGRLGNLVMGQNVSFFIICDKAIL